MTSEKRSLKKTADPKAEDIKAFKVVDAIPGVKRGKGGLVCLYDRLVPLAGEDVVLPLAYV